MAKKTEPLGICDHCKGEIPHDLWYTVKGTPRLHCNIQCRQTANSRVGSEIRSKKARQRVARGQWQNPREINPPDPARIAAGVSQARKREVKAGTWRNPALTDEARKKLSRPRKHSGALHRAIEKLKQGLKIADLTPEEVGAHRAYRAKLRSARLDEVNAYHRRRYHTQRAAMTEAEKETQRARWRKQREKRVQRGPNRQLVEARQAAGLSQSDLSEAVGVAQVTVSGWELYSVRPRQAKIRRRVAKVLGVDEAELWSRRAPSPP